MRSMREQRMASARLRRRLRCPSRVTLDSVHALRFGAQLIAEIWMRHRDELVGAITNRFTLQPCDAIFRYDIVHEVRGEVMTLPGGKPGMMRENR